jgi:hypothetical protein
MFVKYAENQRNMIAFAIELANRVTSATTQIRNDKACYFGKAETQ